MDQALRHEGGEFQKLGGQHSKREAYSVCRRSRRRGQATTEVTIGCGVYAEGRGSALLALEAYREINDGYATRYEPRTITHRQGHIHHAKDRQSP